MTDANTASSQPNATATAREVAQELGGFTRSLRESGQKLEQEIANINTAKAGIKEELDDTIKTFVKNTLTDIKGEKFDEIARIAQGVPELGAQGLAFYLKKLTDSRDSALATVNASLDETIDVEGFQDRYTAAKSAAEAAGAKVSTASAASDTAEAAIRSWQKTADFEFVALDKKITSEGGVALTADNRAFYEPKNIFAAAWNYMTKGAQYREVRGALKEYGHGKNGKDAFADLAGFKAKDSQLAQTFTDSEATLAAAQAEQTAAKGLLSKFGAAAGQIKSDAELLTLVQDKVVSYFSTPEFTTAISKQYGEDFPRSIPLLTAKTDTLTKLEEGVQAKLDTVNANYLQASTQYAKLSKLPAYQKLNVDMDDLQKRNRARVQEYDNYATAANQSWNRTTSWSPSPSVVYVDNSPSFFEMMLIADMMNSNRNYNYNERIDFVPTPVSSYQADLMGLNNQSAQQLGIPESVFDTSPAIQQQMADIGISDYKTNDFLFDSAPAGIANDNSNASSAFDNLFDTQINDATTSYTPSQSRIDSGLFDTAPRVRSNDDSPSFSSPSFGGSSNS